MLTYYHSDPLILSSLCSHSSSLITCALRLGGMIDPEFLIQCQIIDEKFQQQIQQLKPIPIQYESLPMDFICQEEEELYLDMDIPSNEQFFNSSQFHHYNSWLINDNQWNIVYTFNDDLII